jgi:hypothetical protein
MNLRLPFATTGSPKPKYREVFEFNGAVRSSTLTPLPVFFAILSCLSTLSGPFSLFNRENTGNTCSKAQTWPTGA